MSHSVEIKDDLYEEIKEFCKLNNIKIGRFINELLEKQFMIEKYGDTPFVNFGKKVIEENDKVQENYEKIIEGAGGEDKYNEMITDLIFDDGGDKIQDEYDEINEQLLPKEEISVVTVPDEHTKTLEKKNNQPTKRRLKSK